MIKIQGLTKKFNDGAICALDNVSCSIPKNTMVGFIGPDGSGKTTLLRILAGIMTPDSGVISYFGNEYLHNESSIKELHKVMAYMPQKFGLYEDLSIIENLELYAKLHGLLDDDRLPAFKKVLSITKLDNFQDRLAGNLSGGMKQKLGLACSLLKKPKILILDEPSVGVDPISRQDLITMVNSMIEDTTVLWSTAYLDEAENLDHIIFLNNGRVEFEGNPHELIKSVSSRVFTIKNVGNSKREVASKILKIDEVIDSVIHGQDVRFITSNDTVNFRMPDSAIPATATFEDACIDMLGGLNEKESAVAKYMDGIKFVGDDAVVEAINLTKKFGDFTATDNVSFSVKRGKIFGLLGPNGSGKSTTFKMLCGLLRQNSGTAKIVGIDIANMGCDAKMNLGYMAQKFSLYSILSIKQNLEFFAGAYRLKGKKHHDAVNLMLDIFHLRQFEDVSASVLSLGYKQRLALACSIMHKPQVLFLDEPTSGVDPITRKEFWLHINCMVQHGVSVVVTTHFMDEAENCDEIALVYKGKIRAMGTSDYLKGLCKNYKDPTLEQAFMSIIKNVDIQESMS